MPFAQYGTRGGRVLVEPMTPVLWKLNEEVRYIGETDEFMVPAGYVTDFATIPRIAVWLIPRFGAYTPAAILHDFILTECVASGRVSAVDADGIFLRALRELKVPPYRRALMWTGVRWGSLFSGRTKGWLSTAPRVLLYSAAFLASVLPPLAMLVVGAALVVHGAIERVSSILSDRDEPTSGSLST